MAEPKSSPSLDRLGERLRARHRSLAPALQRVAAFLDAYRVEAMTLSAAELAAQIGTSDATVIRTVKALGFDGLPDLRRQLAASFGAGSTAADNMSRTLSEIDSDPERAIEYVLTWHHDTASRLRTSDVRAQISAAVARLGTAARIATFGIGPSAPLAAYAALQIARIGRPSYVLSGQGSTLADQLLSLAKGDVLLMFAYGQASKEASATVEHASHMRVPIILVTDSLEEKLARRAKIIVPVPRGSVDKFALHGVTFMCVEAIVLGVAALDRERTMTQLARLNQLRKFLGVGPRLR